jgi:hypothetical protein
MQQCRNIYSRGNTLIRNLKCVVILWSVNYFSLFVQIFTLPLYGQTIAKLDH